MEVAADQWVVAGSMPKQISAAVCRHLHLERRRSSRSSSAKSSLDGNITSVHRRHRRPSLVEFDLEGGANPPELDHTDLLGCAA